MQGTEEIFELVRSANYAQLKDDPQAAAKLYVVAFEKFGATKSHLLFPTEPFFFVQAKQLDAEGESDKLSYALTKDDNANVVTVLLNILVKLDDSLYGQRAKSRIFGQCEGSLLDWVGRHGKFALWAIAAGKDEIATLRAETLGAVIDAANEASSRYGRAPQVCATSLAEVIFPGLSPGPLDASQDLGHQLFDLLAERKCKQTLQVLLDRDHSSYLRRGNFSATMEEANRSAKMADFARVEQLFSQLDGRFSEWGKQIADPPKQHLVPLLQAVLAGQGTAREVIVKTPASTFISNVVAFDASALRTRLWFEAALLFGLTAKDLFFSEKSANEAAVPKYILQVSAPRAVDEAGLSSKLPIVEATNAGQAVRWFELGVQHAVGERTARTWAMPFDRPFLHRMQEALRSHEERPQAWAFLAEVMRSSPTAPKSLVAAVLSDPAVWQCLPGPLVHYFFQ